MPTARCDDVEIPLLSPALALTEARSSFDWTERRDLEQARAHCESPPGGSLFRRSVVCLLLALVIAGAWSAGNASRVIGSTRLTRPCNPYHRLGHLHVNTSVPAENRWEPFDSSKCTPEDYLSAIVSPASSVPVNLDFARNKTILLIGDSVDRDHNLHFCIAVKGIVEVITAGHPLSPPYPIGQETVPPGYNNSGESWQEFIYSRPHVCHVKSLDLRIVSIFHFGFRDRDESDLIGPWPHYYPPHSIEDRIDLIALPLLANLATEHGIGPTPAMVSITPGLWDNMRMVYQDNAEQARLTKAGEPIHPELDSWSDLSEGRMKHLEQRMESVLRHIARAFVLPQASRSGAPVKVVWRALHHIREFSLVPFHRIQAIDQIGRRVVEKFVEGVQGTAGLSRRRGLLGAFRRLGQPLGEAAIVDDGTVDRLLGNVLEINEWGALMLGQERHFADNVHPLPLPSSYLYGNIILTHLKLAFQS